MFYIIFTDWFWRNPVGEAREDKGLGVEVAPLTDPETYLNGHNTARSLFCYNVTTVEGPIYRFIYFES